MTHTPRRNGTLVVVSHTPHYLREDQIVGWGPTVREISFLASLFDQVFHIAPVHQEPVPANAEPYSADNVHVVAVPKSGGESILEKLSIFGNWPRYAVAIWRQFRNADVVHIRCPANISLLAILLLPLIRSRGARWIKYAGNWRPVGDDPASYRFQRWWLRRAPHRAQVTVNGRWTNEPAHIHSFLNPCLTDAELEEGASCGSTKRLELPVRLLFVGALERSKGAERVIHILAEVLRRGIDARLELIGDGPDRSELELSAEGLGISPKTTFQGWLPRSELPQSYRAAHVLVLPSDSEGWPKVLSEAMAYGVVPLASDVGSIPQVLVECRCGRALPKDSVAEFANEIEALARNPDAWKRESESGHSAAPAFGYSTFLDRVSQLLELGKATRLPNVHGS